MAKPPTKWLTVADVAARLQVHPQWVYDHRQELGGFKIGGKVRFTEESLCDAATRASRTD